MMDGSEVILLVLQWFYLVPNDPILFIVIVHGCGDLA